MGARLYACAAAGFRGRDREEPGARTAGPLASSRHLPIEVIALNTPPTTAAPQGLIRPATTADVAAIHELEAHFDSDRMSARSIRHFLTARSARVWVAERDRQIVGNLVLLLRRGSHAARVYSVVVSPLARGQRFGERLVAAAEAGASALGLGEMRLEVRVDNAPARALYAKLGYREQRRLPAFYEDGGDGLRLVKPLSAARLPAA